MTISTLKAMNEKELCIWSSKVNAKELKAILKENGFKGYSRLKKAELLDIVLDMIVSDEVEVNVVNNEENNINNVLSTMFIDEVEDINIKEEIEKKLKTKLEFNNSFGSILFNNGHKKSKEEYINDAVKSQKKELDINIKKAKENKDLNKVANELNKCFLQLGSGLKAEVITTKRYSTIRNSLYIYAKGVCLKCYDADFYLTKLDKFISKNDEEEDSWFDYVNDDGLSKRDVCKEENKLDMLYIYRDDDCRLELPLNVESINSNLIEYRMKLLNDKNIDVDMSMSDWFDVTSESGWIEYNINVDELIAMNRAKKGQKINFGYMSKKAMSDLYDKTSATLNEINNIKLLK